MVILELCTYNNLNCLKLICSDLFSRKGNTSKNSDEVETPTGKKKEKLVETYQGLPVIGEGVVVEVDTDGEITGKSTPEEAKCICL